MLMVMAHSLRHDQSKEATESLLKIISMHLPEGTPFPATKYLFFKNFSAAECSRTRHFYCSACSAYIGEVEKAAVSVSCKQCSTEHTVSSLLKKFAFFFSVDLESQLIQLLQDIGEIQPKQPRSYDVGDITESLAYHSLPLQPDDLTLTFNTDGVPLFESSGYGIWPLLAQVNELPYKDRVQRLVLAGLWFRPKKPVMNTFFSPFVQTMNILSGKGVHWTDNSGNRRTSRVFPGPCTADSVARADIMCMSQFNGQCGCAWCEHPGVVVKKGNGHCRVYVPRKRQPKMRTDASFVSHAHKARTAPKKVSCGVKGVSILAMLTFFSLSSGFVVDYMHAACSGFVKTTTLLWLKSRKCRKFRLRKRLGEVNQMLMAMRPTWELSRLPRSLNDVKHWKSSEWRSWLFFLFTDNCEKVPPIKLRQELVNVC